MGKESATGSSFQYDSEQQSIVTLKSKGSKLLSYKNSEIYTSTLSYLESFHDLPIVSRKASCPKLIKPYKKSEPTCIKCETF